MENKYWRVYVCCIVLGGMLGWSETLSLPNYTTRKPRITKYMTSTPAPPPPPTPAEPAADTGVAAAAVVVPEVPSTTEAPVTAKNKPYYRVRTSTGSTCILMTTDALIEIRFKSNIGNEKIDAFVPDNAVVEGDCRYEDLATLRMSWPGYLLEWKFAKTPGGERWYVEKISLIASTELHHYHSIQQHGSMLKVVHDTMAFPTPVGRSYSCGESVIQMTSSIRNDPLGLTGTLFLREFQVQPFMYRGDVFESEYECGSQSRVRDETAPIAVGSTLAVAVLCIVTGYGAFRYFKVKKVQYNTME